MWNGTEKTQPKTMIFLTVPCTIYKQTNIKIYTLNPNLMNCMEALAGKLIACEPCIQNAFIIEFEQLPEHEKYNFVKYDKNEHFNK